MERARDVETMAFAWQTAFRSQHALELSNPLSSFKQLWVCLPFKLLPPLNSHVLPFELLVNTEFGILPSSPTHFGLLLTIKITPSPNHCEDSMLLKSTRKLMKHKLLSCCTSLLLDDLK